MINRINPGKTHGPDMINIYMLGDYGISIWRSLGHVLQTCLDQRISLDVWKKQIFLKQKRGPVNIELNASLSPFDLKAEITERLYRNALFSFFLKNS